MKINSLWAAAPLALASAAAVLAAQPCMRQSHFEAPCAHGGYHKIGTGECEAAYYDNKMWPQQYIWPSRRGICQSIDLMVANGWRRHNLLGDQYFDRNTNQLTEAGRLKIRWILTQAPPSRRTIYLERTPNDDQTAERRESVDALLASLASGEAAPAVQETNVRDIGHPAAGVDAAFTGFQASLPAPMLPPSATSGGSSGAGAPAN